MAATTHSIPASGAGSSLAIIQESTFKTTPNTPSLVELACLPPTLNPEAEQFVSEQINALRVQKASRHTGRSATLQVPMELAYGAADALLAAVLKDEWAVDTPEAGTDQLVFDTTELTYACELKRGDAATPYILTANGTLFNSFSLEIVADGTSAVRANFGALVAKLTVGTSSADADGYTAPPANSPLIAADGAIEMDESAFVAVAVSVQTEDPRQPIRAIGSLEASAFAPNGNRTLTGELSFYASNKDHLDRYLAEAGHEIVVTLTDPDDNVLMLTLHEVRFGAPRESADSGAIRVTAPFTAIRSTGATPLTINRTPAA